MKWAVFSLAAFVLFLSACAKIDSSSINTSGICADISVGNDSTDNVTVSTKLTAGCGVSASYVDLSSGESLVASYQGTNSTLIKHTDITNNISYSVSTNQAYASNSPVYVALYRTSSNVNAPNSYVDLPPSFTITAPANSQKYANTGTITVSLDNYNSADYVVFDLNCTLSDGSGFNYGSQHYSIPGGPFNIPVSTLGNAIWGPGQSTTLKSCTGSASVVRKISGYPDPNLDSASTVHGQYAASASNLSINF